jgi:PncC family amidohydrolase
MRQLTAEIGELLREKGLTLGTVESATGGLISHLITTAPGSSDYFKGGIVAYSNELKMRLVGVKPDTLERYGAVSRETALEMAAGARERLRVDISLADTGIAGPGGATPEKPVGLFYLGLAHEGGAESRKHLFTGDREQNKSQAAEAALTWLKEYLSSLA